MNGVLSLFPLRITTTTVLEMYNRCPYLLQKLVIEGWSKSIYNIHLLFGGEFAGALELTRRAYYYDCKTAEESIAIGLNHIVEHFAEVFQASNFHEDIKTPAKCQEVFEQYFREFPLDDDITPYVLPNGELSVECRFTVELPILHPELGVPILLSVKPDMLGFDARQILNLIDEKTASQSGMSDMAKTTDKYRSRYQFMLYTSVINQHPEYFGETKVKQAKVRRVVITKTKLVDSKKENKGKIPRNVQVVEEYSFEIDRWLQKTVWEETLLIVQEMVDSYKAYKEGKPYAFRRRRGNCEQFFNPCELTLHCTSGAAQDMERLGYQQMWKDKDEGILIPLKEKLVELNLLGEENG
jgi:hypothetical protein